MPAIRKEIKSDFTTVHNKFIKDPSLPLCCKGLLLLMISLPDNWNFSINGLQTLVCEGRDKVRSTLKELEKHGYLRRNRITDKKGVISDWEYIFSDEPIFKDDISNESVSVTIQSAATMTETSTNTHHNTDVLYVESPHADFPHVGDKPVINNYKDKKLNNKKLNNILCSVTAKQSPSVLPQNNEISDDDYSDIIEETICYLNKKASKRYKASTKVNQLYIISKIDEGFCIEDFKKVIDIKCSEWLHTKMAKYLRPQTLFGDNFESYLNSDVNSKVSNSNFEDPYDPNVLQKYTFAAFLS